MKGRAYLSPIADLSFPGSNEVPIYCFVDRGILPVTDWPNLDSTPRPSASCETYSFIWNIDILLDGNKRVWCAENIKWSKNIVFNPFPIKKSHKKIIANFDSVCIRFVTFYFKNALAK